MPTEGDKLDLSDHGAAASRCLYRRAPVRILPLIAERKVVRSQGRHRAQTKIEAPVLRGCVYDVVVRSIAETVEDAFSLAPK